MKKMDLSGKEKNELITLLKKSQGELSDLRMQNFMGKLKNPKSISIKRKEIARLLTQINKLEQNV